MREIKFRAWAEGRLNTPDYTTVLIGLRGFVQGEKFVLMQFTGLRDKNGQEIYEGDIVREDSGIILTIEWCDQEVGWRPVLEFLYRNNEYGAATDFVGLEVIGNIYENPELLEAKP